MGWSQADLLALIAMQQTLQQLDLRLIAQAGRAGKGGKTQSKRPSIPAPSPAPLTL
jgi:hypothetical protein